MIASSKMDGSSDDFDNILRYSTITARSPPTVSVFIEGSESPSLSDSGSHVRESERHAQFETAETVASGYADDVSSAGQRLAPPHLIENYAAVKEPASGAGSRSDSTLYVKGENVWAAGGMPTHSLARDSTDCNPMDDDMARLEGTMAALCLTMKKELKVLSCVRVRPSTADAQGEFSQLKLRLAEQHRTVCASLRRSHAQELGDAHRQLDALRETVHVCEQTIESKDRLIASLTASVGAEVCDVSLPPHTHTQTHFC
jgi:hypothetical protein